MKTYEEAIKDIADERECQIELGYRDARDEGYLAGMVKAVALVYGKTTKEVCADVRKLLNR